VKVLALGATGFIGSHVVRQLIALGHDVTVFHRGQSDTGVPEGASSLIGDRASLEASRRELERLAPDTVLDMILYTEAQARALMREFRSVTDRVVVASSADVYRNYGGLIGQSDAPPDEVPLDENAPLRERLFPYRGNEDLERFAHRDEYDKILAERVVMSDPDLGGTVLRLPAVYGPGDRQHRLRSHLERMDGGRPAILLESGQDAWRWTRGYVENVAAAIALAVTKERATGNVYNVGKESAATERDWIGYLAEVTGWRGRVVTLSRSELPEPLQETLDWRFDLELDTGRIRRELGYGEAVPRREAIERTVEWERSHPADEPPDYAAEDMALATAAWQPRESR
jgi:nucleoside-diphosphate-sugar epimerase